MMRSGYNEILTRVGQGTPIGELMRRYWHSICTVDEVLSRTDPPSPPSAGSHSAVGSSALNCDCIVAAEDKQDREPPEMIFHGR
jgi:hypothetical protein